MGIVSFLLRLPFSFLGYLLSITKNSVLIAAAIIYLDHINMRNHLLQLKYRQSFQRDYVPIHARFYDSLKRLTVVPPESQ